MTYHTKFCIKSPMKQETHAALNFLLDIKKGDVLIFGYGYIGAKGAPVEYFKEILEWLAKSDTRSVEIYVGILKDPSINKAEFDKEMQKVTSDFKALLKDDSYAMGCTDRIRVAAIAGMHCKFAICCATAADQKLVPLAGIFGSSNLSEPALTSTNRLELDLYIGEHDPLMKQFTAAIEEILDEADKLELFDLGYDVRKRTYDDPAEREAKANEAAMEEALRGAAEDARKKDMGEITRYWNQGMSRVDREALMDSDEQQEISSWKPSHK